MYKLSLQCRYSKYILLLKNGSRLMGHSSKNHYQNSKSAFSKRVSLNKKDVLPQEYELIYRAPMESYISFAKNISTITAIIMSAAAAYSATSQDKLPAPSFESFGLVSQPNDIWYFSFGFVLVTVITRLFVSKYPLRIYRSNEKYVAIYDSQIPFRPSKHAFCKGEVVEVNSKFNPWSNCTYRLGNRSSLLLSLYFRTPADFNKMLGYN